MCSPTAIMGIQALGTATAAQGAIDQGKSQQAYYSFLAAQNRINQPQIMQAANQNTSAVVSASGREETNLSRQTAATEGAQRATAAASGMGGGSATTGDILSDTESKAALDRAAIRQNANLRTRAIATEATGRVNALEGQAQGFELAGQNARTAGTTNAISTVMSGAGQVASNWYKYMQTAPGAGGAAAPKAKPTVDPLADLYGAA